MENGKKLHWYLCPMNNSNSLLPPQSHGYVLSYKPNNNDIYQINVGNHVNHVNLDFLVC